LIKVKNFGVLPQSNFILGLSLDGGSVWEQLIPDTLLPDSTIDVLFTSGTFDLSDIGDYDFKIYTRLNKDENIFNDTLRQVVTKLTRFDAAVTGFTNLENRACGNSLEVGIIITNMGVEPLTTATIEWRNTGSVDQTISWEGLLETGESDTVYVLLNQLYDGNNNILARTLNPNGWADEDTKNDSLGRGFESLAGGEKIYLEILTDYHPSETSWVLEDASGTVLYEGGNYELSNTKYIEEWCLPEGCYKFTIKDAFGDGMVFVTDGAYQIYDENGKIFSKMKTPDFGTKEEDTFCTPFACALTSEISTDIESEFGAQDGSISVAPIAGIPPFQYSIYLLCRDSGCEWL